MSFLIPLIQLSVSDSYKLSCAEVGCVVETPIYLNKSIIKMLCPMAGGSQLWLVGQNEPLHVKESAESIEALCNSAILVKLAEPVSLVGSQISP